MSDSVVRRLVLLLWQVADLAGCFLAIQIVEIDFFCRAHGCGRLRDDQPSTAASSVSEIRCLTAKIEDHPGEQRHALAAGDCLLGLQAAGRTRKSAPLCRS